ncbi:uncharacterized protein LOC116787961 [Chiroxiphia lanceolata]|uniref:uncharacterized protein LOC116787961 n=1 Tax=Chiroxiphia lanceolata TaxID=296741 RepID=UPI0013CE3E71|nr:uncharacterized protein LOC116787961 [Chiroxiphia lanceolata]XP_032546040.1 uncharacterized protein LOC116787961 [Chiroxiphia lanceolata]XP_032546041.1 uncharacterized protein LOC116787961 [Chiroxiphia lanceolata]
MGRVGAMSDGSILLSLFVLLLATAAVWLAIGHWQQRVLGTPKNPGSQARGSPSSQVAPVEAPNSSTAQATAPQRPDGPVSHEYIPCGCGPSCIPCMAVAQELQDLVMLVWVGNGMSFPLDSEMWQVLWENLEELVERGHLPCCSSSSSTKSPHSSKSQLPWRTSVLPRALIRRQASVFSISSFLPRTRFCRRYSILTRRPCHRRAHIPLKASIPSKSLHSSESLHLPRAYITSTGLRSPESMHLSRASISSTSFQSSESLTSSQSLHPYKSFSENCQTPDGVAPIDHSPCSLKAAGIIRTHSSLKMHMAKESLAVKMGAQPIPVVCFQEQAAQQEESCSHQCPPLDSWDAVAVPTGNTPCVGEAQKSALSAGENPPVAEEVADLPSPGSSPQPDVEDQDEVSVCSLDTSAEHLC